MNLRRRQSAAGVGAQVGGRDFAAFLSNLLISLLPIHPPDSALGEDGTNDGHRARLGLCVEVDIKLTRPEAKRARRRIAYYAPAHGLAAGLAHPFAGLDHLLAMIAVGIWSAAVLHGARRLAGPAFFLLALLAGAFIGVQTGAGVAGAYIEAGVALSVALFGALLLARRQLPAAAGVARVAAAGCASCAR